MIFCPDLIGVVHEGDAWIHAASRAGAIETALPGLATMARVKSLAEYCLTKPLFKPMAARCRSLSLAIAALRLGRGLPVAFSGIRAGGVVYCAV
ncbi:hypothetical protein [Acidocella sp.]|uniref:hypothetical protein n=1 Tax=Acidocella sp. TaxID=50710 RepID=UPI003D0125C1